MYNQNFNNNSDNQQFNSQNITFEITQPIAIISRYDNEEKNIHNTKEVNMVSWNGRPASLDIRNWRVDPVDNKKKPGKGISFNIQEAQNLCSYLISAGFAQQNN